MARKIVDGKAVVSAKELKASGLSLRDFLNKEQGLTRKAPEGTKFGVSGPRNPSVKDDSQVVKREGARPAAPAPKEEAPKPQASEKSLLDKYRESDTAKGFRDARATFGDTPSTDMLMKAGQVGIGMEIGKLLGPASSAVGAAAKYLSKPTGLRIKKPNFSGTKDNPAASVADDIKEPSFNPEKMVDRSRSEPALNPDKMVDRRSTTFPGRTEPKFNPDKMTGYDRPEPMKKGGKVSASSRGDGIAQRGKTKGRMC